MRLYLWLMVFIALWMRVGFAQGEKIQVWRFPGVIKVLVSNDGSRVAAQSTSGEVGRLVGREIRVYDVVHAKELGAVLIGPKDFNYGNESDLADTQSFSPHGEHLLVKHLTKGEALVECWNVRDVPRLEWKKPGEGVLAMRWVEHEIVVLTKREVQHWDEKGTMSERVPLQGVRFDEGTTAAISEDGALVAAGDDRAFVVDARTGKLQRELPLPGAAFRLEFSPDEKYLLSNGEKLDLDAGGAPIGQTATFSLFRLSDGKQLWKDPLNATGTVFSRDSRAVWEFDRQQFWDIETQKFIADSVMPSFPGQWRWAFLSGISRDNRTWVVVSETSAREGAFNELDIVPRTTR